MTVGMAKRIVRNAQAMGVLDPVVAVNLLLRIDRIGREARSSLKLQVVVDEVRSLVLTGREV